MATGCVVQVESPAGGAGSNSCWPLMAARHRGHTGLSRAMTLSMQGLQACSHTYRPGYKDKARHRRLPEKVNTCAMLQRDKLCTPYAAASRWTTAACLIQLGDLQQGMVQAAAEAAPAKHMAAGGDAGRLQRGQADGALLRILSPCTTRPTSSPAGRSSSNGAVGGQDGSQLVQKGGVCCRGLAGGSQQRLERLQGPCCQVGGVAHLQQAEDVRVWASSREDGEQGEAKHSFCGLCACLHATCRAPAVVHEEMSDNMWHTHSVAVSASINMVYETSHAAMPCRGSAAGCGGRRSPGAGA